MATSSKKIVDVNVYITGESDINYTGRCLGLLTPAEYAGLIEHPELRKKLYTVETKSLDDISKVDNIAEMRLAIAVKERNGKPVVRPTLFITEELDLVTSVMTTDTLTINGANDGFFIFSEEGV